VKTQKRRFIGRNAMLEREKEAEHWCMHLLELEDSEIDPFYLHSIFRGDEAI